MIHSYAPTKPALVHLIAIVRDINTGRKTGATVEVVKPK